MRKEYVKVDSEVQVRAVLVKTRFQECTHPECEYVAEWVTNHHCQTAHGMSRKELQDKYGEIKDFTIGGKLNADKGN